MGEGGRRRAQEELVDTPTHVIGISPRIHAAALGGQDASDHTPAWGASSVTNVCFSASPVHREAASPGGDPTHIPTGPLPGLRALIRTLTVPQARIKTASCLPLMKPPAREREITPTPSRPAEMHLPSQRGSCQCRRHQQKEKEKHSPLSPHSDTGIFF